MKQEGPRLLYHPDGVWCGLYYYPRWIIQLMCLWGELVGYSTDYDSCGAFIWGCFIVGLFKRTSTEDKLVTKLKIRMWLWLTGAYVFTVSASDSPLFRLLNLAEEQEHVWHLKRAKSRSSPTAQSQTCGWSASSQEELIFYLMFDWNRTQTPSCFPDIGREITHLQGRFSTFIKCGS